MAPTPAMDPESCMMWAATDAVLHGRRLRRIPADVNIHRLLRLARRHRVDAVVASAFQSPVRPLTREIEYSISTKMLVDDLQALSSQLRQLGVSYGVTRGPVVRAYYPDPRMRRFVDLDIYVSKTDLPNFAAAVSTLGYRQGNASKDRKHIAPMTEVDRRREKANGSVHAYLKLSSRGDLLVIEPHTRLFPTYSPINGSADWLLALDGTNLEVGDFRTLTGEALWIEMTSHIYGHAVEVQSVRAWSDLLLYRLYDLAVLFLNTRLDWNTIWEASKTHGLEVPVAFGTALARDIYPDALESVNPAVLDPMVNHELWHFDSVGSFSPVVIVSEPPALRLFTRTHDEELREWERQASASDEERLMNPYSNWSETREGI